MNMRMLAAILLFGLCPTAAWGQPVQIRLPTALVATDQATIRIGDIAELTGGADTLRAQLAGLDLDELSSAQPTLTIAADRIRYRALLAGIPADAFQLVGPGQATVQFVARSDWTQWIEQSVRRQIAETFSLDESLLEVHLLTPIDFNSIASSRPLATWHLEAKLPTELPLGQRNLELALTGHGGTPLPIQATFKCVVYRDLVMAKTNVARGELLDESNIERVRRPVDQHQVRFAAYEQVVGKVAQSDIQQYALIRPQLVRQVADRTATTPDVKRNDLVNVIVRQGGLSIVLKNARARQNGRIGEAIEFINPSSQKIMRARIIDSTTALLEM